MPDPRLRRRDVLLGIAGLGTAGLASACSHGGPATATASSTRARPTSSGSASSSPAGSQASSATAAAQWRLNASGDVVGVQGKASAIALTFHGAGTATITREVLDVLARAKARVTVFAVGTWLDAQPDLGRALLAAGHELGNHTYRHLPMRTLTPGQADTEVARCASSLTHVLGGPGHWFRPSGTPSSTPVIRAAARMAGYGRCVSYDVDSLDWTDPGPAAVTHNVLTHARAGSIVSLHLGHAGTVAALPGLIAQLAASGLHPQTVSELLA